jgi:UDP-N-acetylglucosamine 1-carboxyvinyltransferase
MDKLIIQGGTQLNGTIYASGAKNSSLPIIFATILSDEEIIVHNTPQLNDVYTALRVLKSMGGDYILDGNNSIVINNSGLNNFVADYELVKTMRASILTLGPLLAKHKQAKVSLPGGCAIGARPVNLHIESLKKLGADISIEDGYIIATTDGLVGCDITLEQKSVTATENVILAATLADGITTINNAAKEPEVVDLVDFLNKIGAKISGAGTETITITGVKKLAGGEYSVCYDRIEIGTYLVAAAITSGKITIKNAKSQAVQIIIQKLIAAGCEVIQDENSITLDATQTKLKAVDITTGEFPEFPTDMQAQFCVLNAVAEGPSTITENIFENRFMHISELNRMGANLEINHNQVLANGSAKLSSAALMATDLRASASLVLAGLCANGATTIDRVYHLDRGYENIEEKLKKLGANIKRTK